MFWSLHFFENYWHCLVLWLFIGYQRNVGLRNLLGRSANRWRIVLWHSSNSVFIDNDNINHIRAKLISLSFGFELLRQLVLLYILVIVQFSGNNHEGVVKVDFSSVGNEYHIDFDTFAFAYLWITGFCSQVGWARLYFEGDIFLNFVS